MKKYLAMILALVMALSLVACGDKQDDAADNNGDTATGSVYWLNFKPEADATLQKVAAMYTEKTGVPVTVVTAASGTYNETLTAEMDKSAPPTLFVVGNQAAVETWGDYCYNLSGTDIANQLNTDAYNLYDADGKLCSIGYCYECYGIIVNKALLAEAGYADGFDTTIVAFNDLGKRVCEVVQMFLAEVGINAKIETYDSSVRQSMIANHQVPMFSGQWGAMADADLVLPRLFTKEAIGGMNFTHYTNPKLDELFAAGRSTYDEEERVRIYNEAVAILADEAPWCPLYIPSAFCLTNANLQGVEVNGESIINMQNLHY